MTSRVVVEINYTFVKLIINQITMRCVKLLIATAMIMPFTCMAQKSETYKVVKVQGEIQRVKTGNLLFLGEDVTNNENYNFKNEVSRAIVVNKEKGCLVLSSKANNEGPQFLPSSNKMSVRAVLPTQPSEIMEYYYGEVFVSGFDSLKIDNDKMKIDDVNYFSVKYDANGQSFNEKVELVNNSLVLPSSLLTNKPSTVTVCYNDEYGEKSKTDFTPVYADNSVLKEELNVIFTTLKGKQNEKVSASANFINDFYGKTTEEAVESWIKANMGK